MAFRKTFTAIASLVLAGVLLITGCKGGDTSSDSSSNVSDDEQTESARKVGFIMHGDGEADAFSSAFNEQRKNAAEYSNIDTTYIDGVSISRFEEAVKKLAEAGCTEIIACSPIYANILASVAEKYMNINFVSYGTRTRTANVYAYNEQPFQSAYIAGMVAAFNSEAEKIGVVSDIDMLYPTAVINAVQLGVEFILEDGKTLVTIATADNEIKQGIDQLLGEGCDVIVCYTESSYAMDYCESKGVKFIGSTEPGEREDGYENLIASFYCGRRDFLLSVLKLIQMDKWSPEAYTGTMANGIVRISHATKAAKPGTQAIVNAILPKVTNGQAFIFAGELKDNLGAIRYMQNEYMKDTEIYNMNWYVRGVTIVASLRQPITETDTSEFVIKT